MKKYLVIGNPIQHSLSPKLHNHWIKKNNINAIYEKKQLTEIDLEEIISELTKVKGIGRWTAEMYLIFNLCRPDVFPVDDLGVIKGICNCYNKKYPLSREQAIKMASKFRLKY